MRKAFAIFSLTTSIISVNIAFFSYFKLIYIMKILFLLNFIYTIISTFFFTKKTECICPIYITNSDHIVQLLASFLITHQYNRCFNIVYSSLKKILDREKITFSQKTIVVFLAIYLMVLYIVLSFFDLPYQLYLINVMFLKSVFAKDIRT